MIELELHGRSEDGGSLILVDSDGAKYRLHASPELRAEISRALLVSQRPQAPSGRVSPGELQTLLRQGLTPAEVAQETGVDPERVLRYFSPVAAEIDHAVTSAQASRVGPEIDSPTMGDLVIDRLAARGVDLDTVEWSASRQPDQEWTVHLTYQQGEETLRASWVAPPGSGRVEAQDPIAAQLTETVEVVAPITGLFPPAPLIPRTRPRAAEVRFEHVDVEIDDSALPPTPQDVRKAEDLVDILNRARGKHTPVMDDMGDLSLHDETMGDESGERDPDAPSTGDDAASHPQEEHPDEDGEDTGQGRLDFVTESLPPKIPPANRKRPGRTPMPSWDEIVFGSKQD